MVPSTTKYSLKSKNKEITGLIYQKIKLKENLTLDDLGFSGAGARRVEGGGFLLLALSFRTPFEKVYTELFGKAATNEALEEIGSPHHKNFECGLKLHRSMELVIEAMDGRLRSYLDLSAHGMMEEAMAAAGGTRSHQELQHDNSPREKREVVAATALLLSMMALALSTGNLVLSQMTSAQLIEHIASIESQVALDALRSDAIGSNVLLLKNRTETLAVRHNLAWEKMDNLLFVHSCDIGSTQLLSWVMNLDSRLNDITDDILMGRLTPRVLPLPALTVLMKKSDIFMNTVYRLNPGLLYQKAQIGLLSAKEGNVTLLMSFPKLNSAIEYQVVDIFDLPLRRTSGQQKLLVMIHLPVTQFLVVNRPKFSLADLTRADIATAKSSLACERLGEEWFCSNWIDLNLET